MGMITVNIDINGHTIYARTATRTKDGKVYNEYTLDTGEKIKHEYDNGAVELAKKMLDTIKEV